MHGLGNYYGTPWGLIEEQKRKLRERQQAAQQAAQSEAGEPTPGGPTTPSEPTPGGPTTPSEPTPVEPTGPVKEVKKSSFVPLLGIGGVLLVGGAIATAYILKKRRQARLRETLNL